MTLFVSYAWTSHPHREWVRQLASTLSALGYEVFIDADVDYSDSLTGFMQRAASAEHVLLVVDENYVDRADNVPTSGVGVENEALSAVWRERPRSWLGVMMKDNPDALLPNWLSADKPRSFWFNSDPGHNQFPGSEQVDELWRWLEDRPARRNHALSARTLRARARRLEEIDVQRDPGNWRNPAMSGEERFVYPLAPLNTFTLGHGEYEFKLTVYERSPVTCQILNDYGKAVGLAPGGRNDARNPASYLTPARIVDAKAHDSILLMNNEGALCWVDVVDIDGGQTDGEFRNPSITFRYQVFDEG